MYIFVSACICVYAPHMHLFLSQTRCILLFPAGRNCILLSLCPQIFGMYIIKLAVAMILAGGVQRIDSSGTKVRGMSSLHLLCLVMVLS